MSQKERFDRDVPVPDGAGRRGRPAKYPFWKMEIGESVLLADSGDPRSSAVHYGKRAGKKFVSRRVAGMRVRIWRVK
jgi:hypothetical protein